MTVITVADRRKAIQSRRTGEDRADADQAAILKAARAAYSFKLALRQLRDTAESAEVRKSAIDGLNMLTDLVSEFLTKAGLDSDKEAMEEARVHYDTRAAIHRAFRDEEGGQ